MERRIERLEAKFDGLQQTCNEILRLLRENDASRRLPVASTQVTADYQTVGTCDDNHDHQKDGDLRLITDGHNNISNASASDDPMEETTETENVEEERGNLQPAVGGDCTIDIAEAELFERRADDGGSEEVGEVENVAAEDILERRSMREFPMGNTKSVAKLPVQYWLLEMRKRNIDHGNPKAFPNLSKQLKSKARRVYDLCKDLSRESSFFEVFFQRRDILLEREPGYSDWLSHLEAASHEITKLLKNWIEGEHLSLGIATSRNLNKRPHDLTLGVINSSLDKLKEARKSHPTIPI